MTATVSDDIVLLDYLIERAEDQTAWSMDEAYHSKDEKLTKILLDSARLNTRVVILLQKYRTILTDGLHG